MFDLYRGPRGSTKCNSFIFKTHSAKIRAGPPKDDKNDLNDEVNTAKTWTGVIPGVFPLHNLTHSCVPDRSCVHLTDSHAILRYADPC